MKISELNGKQIDYWFDYVLAHGQKRAIGELKTETIRRYFGDEVPDLRSVICRRRESVALSGIHTSGRKPAA